MFKVGREVVDPLNRVVTIVAITDGMVAKYNQFYLELQILTRESGQ